MVKWFLVHNALGFVSTYRPAQKMKSMKEIRMLLSIKCDISVVTNNVCHSCRMEELTDPELIRQNAKCDRKICLYGYVRGCHLKHNSRVHIIGTS